VGVEVLGDRMTGAKFQIKQKHLNDTEGLVQMQRLIKMLRWTWFHTWLALLLYWPVCFSFIGGACGREWNNMHFSGWNRMLEGQLLEGCIGQVTI
jgi:hypothetical protein